MTARQPKKRNAIAKDLHTRKYRPRIVRSKKLYSRAADRSRSRQAIGGIVGTASRGPRPLSQWDENESH